VIYRTVARRGRNTGHRSGHRAWCRKSRLPGAVYPRFEIVTRHGVSGNG
jgi:hypothetical protein